MQMKIITKNSSKIFSFKLLLNFTSVSATVEFATAKSILGIRGLVFDKTSLMSSSIFHAFLLICTRAEKSLSQRYVVANGSYIRKASLDTSGKNSRIANQN